ncbi:hypothetical protein MTO96_005449 [Rhipicephalus appendiculatus]
MAEHRATKSGLAAEAHSKIQSKYDPELAGQLLAWVKDVTGQDINTSGDMDNFYDTLKDGVLLCHLVNSIKAGSIPDKKINQSKMAFKCMENINLVSGACTSNGFAICLQSLARKAPKFGVKGMGPKEAEANVRNFSEEQLKAGQNVISLQYGSNKGATQSGINFGNTRHM